MNKEIYWRIWHGPEVHEKLHYCVFNIKLIIVDTNYALFCDVISMKVYENKPLLIGIEINCIPRRM